MLRLLALSLVLASAANAQGAGAELAPNTVTVTGEGIVSAPPDRAIVRLGILTRGETAAAALRDHEADMARVLREVRGFGIADRQISIEALNLGDYYGPEGPGGYQAYRIVAVTVDSLRIVPALIASVVESGANRLDGVQYAIRDATPYQNRALDLAMEKARAKAARLATASGRALGPVIAIQEQGVGLIQPYERVAVQNAAMDEMAAGAPEPGAYSTGSSQIRGAVVVRFLLTD